MDTTSARPGKITRVAGKAEKETRDSKGASQSTYSHRSNAVVAFAFYQGC